MPPSEPESSHTDQIARLVDQLVRGREDVRARHAEGSNGINTTRWLSNVVDEVFQSIHEIALENVPEHERSGLRMTVAATGGYGRRRLAPYSDIDVCFIVPEEDNPICDGVAKEMFFLISRVFTDGASLRVGYSYRTLNELEDLPNPLQTALLDARLVVGDPTLFHRFREELLRTIRPAVFIWHKLNDRLEAMDKHGDSVYVTEPNVKLGAGGLRDLHTAEWIMKATFGTGLDDPWGRLRSNGAITEREFQAITAGREFLLRARNCLHWLEGREQDDLTRDQHQPVALQMGFEDQPGQPAATALMLDYHRHTATIQRISRKVASRSLRSPLGLAEKLTLIQGEIQSADINLITRTPSAALEVLAIAQRYGFPLSADLMDQIGLFAARPDAALTDPESHRVFLHILRQTRGVYEALRRMCDLDLLRLVIPDFGPLLRRLPSDVSARFTVGEHCLRVVRELEKMRSAPEPDHLFLCEKFNELESPEILVLAALLHHLRRDAEEDAPDDAGSQMAATIGSRLGLDDAASATVAFLVRNADLLTGMARTRDPEQPETAAALAAAVPRQDQLTMLYLLSVANLRTHGGDAWVHVLQDALKRLYLRATEHLGGSVRTLSRTDVNGEDRWLERQFTLRNLPEQAVRDYCADMPASYLLNTDIEKVFRHMQLFERLSAGPVVDSRDEPERPWTVFTVIAPDTPGLLASISGVFYAHNVNVHSARVYTREGATPVALDELLVESHNRPLSARATAEITQDILDVLSGAETLASVLAREGREMGPGEPVRSLHLHNDLSETFTVVEVEMPDEKGLLFRLASAMSALDWVIHNARVGTRGGEVHDVFYVTGPDGRKLSVEDLNIHMALSDGLSAGPSVS